MTWQLISSTGFKAIYTRLPAAAQEGAPLVNVAHNFETERHPNLHHVADTHALAFRFQKWKSFLDEGREFWRFGMNDMMFDVLPLLQEELWNAITHGLMFFLSLFGTGFLMYKAMFFQTLDTNTAGICISSSQLV